MNDRREILLEVEVPGTPEQVWDAIATGPGIDSWFMGTTEVDAGRTVTWANEDNFTHTVQVEGQEDHKVEQGESVEITFDEPGTYHYVCTLHSQDMDGEVIVK